MYYDHFFHSISVSLCVGVIELHSRDGWSIHWKTTPIILCRVAAADCLSCCWSQPHRQYHHQPHLLVPPILSMEHTRLSFVIYNATICTSWNSFLASILSTQSRSFNLFGSCYTYGMSNLWNILVITNQSGQNQLDSYKGVVLCLWWHCLIICWPAFLLAGLVYKHSAYSSWFPFLFTITGS